MLVEGTGGMHAVNLPFLRDRYNGGRLQRWRGGAAIDRREKGRKGRGLGTPAFTSKTFADVKAAKEGGGPCYAPPTINVKFLSTTFRGKTRLPE